MSWFQTSDSWSQWLLRQSTLRYVLSAGLLVRCRCKFLFICFIFDALWTRSVDLGAALQGRWSYLGNVWLMEGVIINSECLDLGNCMGKTLNSPRGHHGHHQSCSEPGFFTSLPLAFVHIYWAWGLYFIFGVQNKNTAKSYENTYEWTHLSKWGLQYMTCNAAQGLIWDIDRLLPSNCTFDFDCVGDEMQTGQNPVVEHHTQSLLFILLAVTLCWERHSSCCTRDTRMWLALIPSPCAEVFRALH